MQKCILIEQDYIQMKSIEQKRIIFLSHFKLPPFLSSYLHQQFGAHPACSFSMHLPTSFIHR